MKKITITLLVCLMVNVARAQSPRTYYKIANGWTDINLSGKIKGKLSWQLENQHRRQDQQGTYNEATVTHNPYHNLNQHVFRPWLHYQLNPNVRLSLMPAGWIGTSKFKNGVQTAKFSELRISPQIITTQNFGRLRMDNRFRYEFRWIGKDQATNTKEYPYQGDFTTNTFKRRFRYQMKLSMPINKAKMEDKTLYAQVYDEVFLNMGQKVANTNLLDQNRVLVGLGYRFTKFVSVEAGYMQQAIFRFNDANKSNVDLNNILQVNLAINNIDVIFKKK